MPKGERRPAGASLRLPRSVGPERGGVEASIEIDHRDGDQKDSKRSARDAPAGAAMGMTLTEIHDG